MRVPPELPVAFLAVTVLWVPAVAKIAATILILLLLTGPPAWTLWVMAGALCREDGRGE